MKHLPLRECGYAIAFIIVLLTTYGGGYFALVERDESINDYMGSTVAIVRIGPSPPPMYVCNYRVGADWSKDFFAPAHEFDRWLRPGFWEHEIDLRNLQVTGHGF